MLKTNVVPNNSGWVIEFIETSSYSEKEDKSYLGIDKYITRSKHFATGFPTRDQCQQAAKEFIRFDQREESDFYS